MSGTRLRLDSHECCSLSLELPSAAFEGIVTVKTETFFFSEFCLCLLIHCLWRIIQIKHCSTADLKTIMLKYGCWDKLSCSLILYWLVPVLSISVYPQIIVFSNTCSVCFSDTGEAWRRWKRQMNLEEGWSETTSLRKAAA